MNDSVLILSFCNKLMCQLLNCGHKTNVLCTDHIEVILLPLYLSHGYIVEIITNPKNSIIEIKHKILI
jgi:hypothetical protein